MTEQSLTVGSSVVAEMVRLAALEVPGVQRVDHAGPPWRRAFRRSAVSVRLRHGRVRVRLAIVARPGQPLLALTGQVRSAVGAAVERLLGLTLETVTVVVEGVG